MVEAWAINGNDIFTAVTGYYVDPSNSLGVAINRSNRLDDGSRSQNDHDPGLNHDSGFFWDNINQ